MSDDESGIPRRKPSLHLFEGCIPAKKKLTNPDARPFEPAGEATPEAARAIVALRPEAVNGRDELGKTLLLSSAGVVAAETLRVLVDAGADVNAQDLKGNAPLHGAAFGGNEAGVDLLLEAGAAVDVVDAEGFSPLHWAARNGHEGVVRRLLEAGANPCTRSSEGHEPLLFAALFGQVGTCRVLLDAGADPFAAAAFDATPFSAARQGGHGEVLELFLEEVQDVFDAIGDDDLPRLSAILAVRPGRLHAHNEVGWRPLHYAALEGTPGAVTLLLDAGADPNGLDAAGMHVLQMTSQDEVARLLIERGADPNRVAAPWGSLLHLAINHQTPSRVKLLLEAGADPRARDPQGRSCLDVARETGDEEKTALVEGWLERSPPPGQGR